MRILLLLIVLAVVGLTLARWLGQPPKTVPAPLAATTNAAPPPPSVRAVIASRASRRFPIAINADDH